LHTHIVKLEVSLFFRNIREQSFQRDEQEFFLRSSNTLEKTRAARTSRQPQREAELEAQHHRMTPHVENLNRENEILLHQNQRCQQSTPKILLQGPLPSQ
jgi:hypothetical protein